jgi:hypothetical protein
MQSPNGQGDRFVRSMGWFLPLFSFGMLLLLTGSKAEVKEEVKDAEAAIICTCPVEAEIPNVSLTASAEGEGTSAHDHK